MKKEIPIEAIVGQIQKSPVEIVQVIKKRLRGIEYIHAAVFRLSGSKAGEKGLCLTPEQWDQLVALAEQAKNVELPKPMKNMPAPPRRKNVSPEPAPPME